jgi:hypothetical protein
MPECGTAFLEKRRIFRLIMILIRACSALLSDRRYSHREANMKGEISFDTNVDDNGQENIEGCYRICEEEWQVFYFTQWWDGYPRIVKNAVSESGIGGVDVWFPKTQILNKSAVIKVLSDILGVDEWSEVRGPDSLQLK